MKEKITSLLLLLAVALCVLPAAHASASSGHDHGIVSPFEKQHHSHKLHCDLTMFQKGQVYCPHKGIGKSEGETLLSSDCGGKTSGATPDFGSPNANDFSFDTNHFDLGMVLTAQPLFSLTSDTGFFLPHQLDHPPQTL